MNRSSFFFSPSISVFSHIWENSKRQACTQFCIIFESSQTRLKSTYCSSEACKNRRRGECVWLRRKSKGHLWKIDLCELGTGDFLGVERTFKWSTCAKFKIKMVLISDVGWVVPAQDCSSGDEINAQEPLTEAQSSCAWIFFGTHIYFFYSFAFLASCPHRNITEGCWKREHR